MTKMICALSLTFLSACMLPGSDDPDLELDAVESEVQVLQTCSHPCSRPTWNGVPVSCTSSTFCTAHSSGVYCQNGQNSINLLCSTCGNGACDSGETPSSCPSDCGCGNGICDANESPCWCAADCSVCGDNVCDELEMGGSCPSDCEPFDPWCF